MSGGCEPRIEAIRKLTKVGGGRVGVWWMGTTN